MAKGKRRDKGDGSLYPRKNRAGKVIGWFGAYTADGESGTKERKRVYAKTKEAAKVLLAKAIADAEDVANPASRESDLVVSEYLTSWLSDCEASLKVTSYRRYEHSVEKHLSPGIGGVPLSELSPNHVQSLYQAKLRDGLSPRTVIHLHEALRRALNRAVKHGLIPRNPCDGVEPPKASKSAMQPLNRGQSRKFVEAVAGTKWEALFLLAITSGMRQGELLGLRWQDVDLEYARVRVNRSFVSWSGRGVGATFVEPKSAASRRVVALTPIAASGLRRHEGNMRTCGLHGDESPIFSTAAGTPPLPQNITVRHFQPILERACLPRIRFHDLRHTCATLLLGEGVHPKIVQELLGHASIRLTLDTYSHYLPDMQDKAVDAIQSVLEIPFQNGPEV